MRIALIELENPSINERGDETGMRNIIVFENVTLDGFMAGPNGEIDWAIRDDEVTEISREGQGSTGMFFVRTGDV